MSLKNKSFVNLILKKSAREKAYEIEVLRITKSE